MFDPDSTRDEGSQSIEFALVLPLVLAAAGAVLLLGTLVLLQLGLHQTAAAAARVAAVSEDAAVTELLDLPPAVTISIQPPSDVRTVGDILIVRAERTIHLLGGSRVLAASAVVRTEDTP